jgi:proteasome assembly chaperone (PAC2) family protein
MEPASPYLRVTETPQLRSPTLITAFAGWNDALEVATEAAQFLVRRWNAKRFADVDPEEFFVFSEQRPNVRIDQGSQRRIDWPSNEFYYRRGDNGRDAIILVGTEPHLRWKTFVETILTHVTSLGVQQVVMLGGLLADVPHSRPPRLTGSATDPRLAEKLGRLNVRSSRYEGPTGIVGVLGQACRARGLSSISIWGNVPHYIRSSPNPRVSVAMLRRLDALIDLDIDLVELEDAAIDFDKQVADAIGRDPEAQAYVRKLEEREERGDSDDDLPDMAPSGEQGSADLPSGEEVIRSLEEFLKRRSTDDEAGRS